MAQLLRSWKESCIVFLPKNFKLFFLAVLNTFAKGLIPFLLYFGIFIVGSLVVLVWQFQYFPSTWLIIFVFCGVASSFGMYAALRPSVSRKNARYFIGFGFHFIWFIIFEFLFRIFNEGIELAVGSSARFWLQGLLFTPFMIYFFFFLLDSQPGFLQQFRNLKSAFMFILYNLPFTLISAFILIIPSLLLRKISFIIPSAAFIAPLLYILYSIIVMFFGLSWFCVMYTKRVYEQYDLYK
ncbi:MAG: hypothetical protein BWY54_00362 [Candidatus Dependentiae bacterium ADurb.Bin331]|nr:MAG: hypothetical protein BWY54_00362 [Candidatus Dependentiae bacterium ADurb.Bin331]